MHFHLPKPFHGWREFAGEVGIIVVGVLIALGARQVVEDWHQRTELRDAEAAMTSELRDDDLPQAYARAAIRQCYADQLDAIEAAVASGIDRTKVSTLARAYAPAVRTWDDQAWQAALSSQVFAHSGAKRTLGWATPYTIVPWLEQTADKEQQELPLLRASLSGNGGLSTAQQDHLFEVISALRRDNQLMSGTSLVLLKLAGEQGLSLTREQRAPIFRRSTPPIRRMREGASRRKFEPARAAVRTQGALSAFSPPQTAARLARVRRRGRDHRHRRPARAGRRAGHRDAALAA